MKNPIRLARYLLECDAHVMLCGVEATQLGLKLGHPSGVVATPQKIAYWQELDELAIGISNEHAGPDVGLREHLTAEVFHCHVSGDD